MVESYSTTTLEAREQRQNQKGTWSKGRRLSARRLATEAAEMDFLLTQDHDAIAALSAEKHWNGYNEYAPGGVALYALAGHPHVFNRKATPWM